MYNFILCSTALDDETNVDLTETLKWMLLQLTYDEKHYFLGGYEFPFEIAQNVKSDEDFWEITRKLVAANSTIAIPTNDKETVWMNLKLLNLFFIHFEFARSLVFSYKSRVLEVDSASDSRSYA